VLTCRAGLAGSCGILSALCVFWSGAEAEALLRECWASSGVPKLGQDVGRRVLKNKVHRMRKLLSGRASGAEPPAPRPPAHRNVEEVVEARERTVEQRFPRSMPLPRGAAPRLAVLALPLRMPAPLLRLPAPRSRRGASPPPERGAATPRCTRTLLPASVLLRSP
jgi:hypothetical protein